MPQIFTSGRLGAYTLVPMLWAAYNAVPPILFFVYFFTKGRVLQVLCVVMQVLGVLFAAGKNQSVRYSIIACSFGAALVLIVYG